MSLNQYFGSGSDAIELESNKAQKFMSIISQLRTVDWRSTEGGMNEDGRALCKMLEKGLFDPVTLRGQLVMFVRGGVVFQSMWIDTAKYYASAGGQEIDTKDRLTKRNFFTSV